MSPPNNSYSQFLGLSSAFEQFRQALELTETKRAEISRSHVYLRDTVLKRLPYVTDAILTGSFKRRTMIAPPQDVDVFVIISSPYSHLTPTAILSELKRDLKHSYPNTSMRNDRPCLVLDFNKVTYDLTPAKSLGMSFAQAYQIPSDTGGGWKLADNPDELASRLQNRNQRLNQMLVPLIKMMKRCRNHNKIRKRSFEIEEIAIKGIYNISTYRDGVQQMLRLLNWTQKGQSLYDIECMDDYSFATFARSTLFGTDFPLI